MTRARVLAVTLAALAMSPGPAAQQQAVRLTVTITLTDASGATTPVPRHALLVSDSPPSAVPLRMVTGLDGTGGINLLPGRYIVESERPVAFEGQAYRWILTVDATAGTDATLTLTADNARVEPATDSANAESLATDDELTDTSPSGLFRKHRGSIVELWSPTRHASGFLIDRRGIIATSREAIGDATSVEVQLTPTTKVAGSVVATDTGRNIALIRVHPATVESVDPLEMACSGPAMPLSDEAEVTTIGIPLGGAVEMAFGAVRRVSSRLVGADFDIRRAGTGGPVFADDGTVAGILSVPSADNADDLLGDLPIVSPDHLCAALGSASLLEGDPPAETALPVAENTTTPMQALADLVAGRPADLEPYVEFASDFDVQFITPIHLYAALVRPNRPTMDFSNWNDYVRTIPLMLLVRVTPKQSESFWMRVVRGMAQTQGASLPAFTRFEPGFARLRAFCGDTEVTPVHPFTLEFRISETEAVREGLAVFSPDTLGSNCGTVRLMVYSEEDPDKADTLDVDPDVLRRIWQDFAMIRG